MIWSVIIGILLALYVLWVIRRKVRQFREGKFCDCNNCGGGCDCGCSSKEGKNKVDIQ